MERPEEEESDDPMVQHVHASDHNTYIIITLAADNYWQLLLAFLYLLIV